MMNGRRGGRPRSRERNPAKRPNTRTEVEDFNKPDYPSLKGAPSTKRQYTYGAAEEPRRLSVDSMPATLQDAMHGVLRRQARQEAEEAADLQRHGQHLKPQVARRYNPARQADDTESESDVESNQLSHGRDNGKHRQGLKPAATKLANPNNTAKVAFDQSFSRPASEDEDEIDDDEDGELTPSESDVSDSRSFNAEGDYFGNASFRSMPPPLAVKPIPLSKTTKPSVPPPSSLSSRPPATRDQYEQATPNRIREAPGKAWSAVKSLLGGRVLAPVSPPESDTQLSQGVSTGTLLEQSQSTTRMRIPKASTIVSSASQPRGTEQRTIPPRGNTVAGRMPPRATTRQPGKPVVSQHDSRFPTDHSEMDDAMQDNIRETDGQVSRQEKWRRILASLFPYLSRRQPRQRDIQNGEFNSPVSSDLDSDVDSELDSTFTDDSINWQQLFNPLTYLRAIYWFFSAAIESVVNSFSGLFSDSLRERFILIGEALVYTVSGFSFILLAVVLSSVAVANLPSFGEAPSISVPSIPIPALPDLGGLASRIGSLIPSITWSSRSAWDDFPGLDELRGDQYAEFGDMINQILRDLRLMKGAGKLHESSIEKLNAVVPKMVHMTLKDGKPVVAQDFWHAIRDLVEKDGSFPMLNKSKAGHYEPSSEKQWKDIAAWLARRPEIASKINEANDGLAKKLPHMWEAWATDNQRKVEQTLRPILDKMKITGSLSDKDIDKRLDQLIKKHVGSSKSGSTVVTREYFLQYLKDEFASHRAEMKAEIIELQPKLEQLIRDTVDLAKKDDSSSITRAEVTKLVDSLVRKSIADLNLEAMAKGRIRSHWDRDLKNQLNYFGVGAGAIIDPKQTSTTFRPDAKYLNDKGLKGAQPYAPIEALLPWHDDGDCWCAAREVNKRGNPHGAKLSVIMGHSIIPQHIVIEHILPGATSNPGARPRQIEVYIKIEDAAIRERLLDFSAAHFPEDLFDWNYAPADLPPQFVKVTQFVYEGAELHDGVHVHRLSSELMALNAETDQVIVRAVSNYGAPNHTCFYRIRLFGHKVPELGDE
ncbi:uncharacterized protein TRIVIDRAFT_223604 [Trichoderma virens Gv29-8]|uniref:SUN domain-containing protein n=1 Tax=Hypocrea virens (strain Gv29-8 / FGSC 10586) TaxID=413071 RepID=G9MXL6_HYPVG|nr:uncharacterized protein TRIVIDRAFT_223604 [Trichoderma virens Gv29-8]EHK20913.1 hypothetical protein TRIVIDRAFT_223604 [Trichoderma virens Gv29-8]UKZ56821.1 hypothetical protein TrVGV298_010662 [Trichoderma virens]